MLGSDFEVLWTDVFEIRLHLHIAARHALDDQALTDDDLATFARIEELSRRAEALANDNLSDAEFVALGDLHAAITSCEGRAATYRLAASHP